MAKVEVAYAGRLKALQMDSGLFQSLKDFVHDLMTFKDNKHARLHLLQEPIAKFYMSLTYFSPEQAQLLLLFKNRDGVTLEQALQSHIAHKLQTSKKEVSSTHHQLCTLDILAPVFQEHFALDALELVGIIDPQQAMLASYKARLTNLDVELLRLLKVCIHDLLDFERVGDARHRLEAHLGSQVFYMFEGYFTPNQMETILTFPSKEGLPLKAIFEAKFKDGKEVCAGHTLAPMLMIHFNIPKDFRDSKEHRDYYKAFCKAWRKK